MTAGTYGQNVSAFKIPTFTVDQYGRLTNATEFTIPTTGVTAGTYGTATTIPRVTVDTYGRVTSVTTNNVSIVETVFAIGNSGGTVTMDWNNGTVQTVTANSNFTLNIPSNMPVGSSIGIIITQDGTGSRLISPSASYKFASGLKTLSTAANSIDFINIFNVGGGVYLAALTRGYA